MKRIFQTLTFVYVIFTASIANAAIGSIWAFGDSLTDLGNIAALGFFEPMPYVNLVPGGA